MPRYAIAIGSTGVDCPLSNPRLYVLQMPVKAGLDARESFSYRHFFREGELPLYIGRQQALIAIHTAIGSAEPV
jgi:hypothetical protein